MMRKLFFALTIMLFGFSAFAQNTNKLLNSYITIKDALVESDSKAASKAIQILYETLKSEETISQKEELLKATEKLSKTHGIEKQRTAFNGVSTAMWKWVKSSDNINHAVYYHYCPMKKAYWLSYEKDIRNPYYGSSMLTCGNLSETKT